MEQSLKVVDPILRDVVVSSPADITEEGSPEPPEFVIDPDDHYETVMQSKTGSEELSAQRTMTSPTLSDAVAGVGSVVMQFLDDPQLAGMTKLVMDLYHVTKAGREVAAYVYLNKVAPK